MSIPAVVVPICRSPVKPGPRRAINRPSPLTQAMDLQALLLADAKQDDLNARDRALVAGAWVKLQEIAMALRGMGKPRPVTARNDPDAKARAKPKLGVLPEPLDAEKKAG